MKFKLWYEKNRGSLVSLSTLWLIPGKWRRVLKSLIVFIDDLIQEESYVLMSKTIKDVS